MARKNSKADQLHEVINQNKGRWIGAEELEEQQRRFGKKTGRDVKGFGKNINNNDINSSANYTNRLYNDERSGLRDKMYYDSDSDSYYIYSDAERGYEDTPYWTGWVDNYFKRPIRDIRNSRGGRGRGSFDLHDFIFSPMGIVLLVIAVCVILYKLVGPAVYSFIMNGPFFKILLIILAGAAVMAILRGAINWPGGIKFVVLLVIGLVLLYSVVGPAVYSFLMSGALFKIICLVIAGAAVIGIIRADMGWPIGVKIAVIAVIWLVLKSEVL